MKNEIQNLEPLDLTQELKPYENQWVALSRDHKRILGAGKTLKEVKQKADKTGEKYLFLRVLPSDLSYVPVTNPATS